jgi:prepilin-type N-terminal cleavage/methylation domain-containing protein
MVRRKGFSLLELVVAAIVLGTILAVVLKFYAAMVAGELAARHRETAAREAANALERLWQAPYEQLTAEKVRQSRLGEEVREGLPGGELAVEISEPDKEPGAKRIVVEVRWRERPNAPPAPVRLVAWRYRIPAKPEAR